MISDTLGQESTQTLTFEEDCDLQREQRAARGESEEVERNGG